MASVRLVSYTFLACVLCAFHNVQYVNAEDEDTELSEWEQHFFPLTEAFKWVEDEKKDCNEHGCTLKDTDKDGINDWEEVSKYGTDPLKADTDNDGLKDGEEINIYRTNPLVLDT